MLIFVATASTGSPAAPPDPVAGGVIIVAVRLNGRDVGDAWQLVRAGDTFHASSEAFAAWRLRLPDAPAVTLHGSAVHALRSPLRTRFDAATQTLDITAPAAAFVGSTLDGLDAAFTAPTPPPPGAFLNYDVRWGRDRAADDLSGAFEAGIFGPAGVFTTTAVGRALTGSRDIVRLETRFSRDDPATATTLRLGDTVGAASAWGRRPYFGGVQWGTNFATRPDMVLLPLPTLHGEAVEPSVVDLYVNNVLSARREVLPGPFTLNQVPVLTGAGEVLMVVRDVLGRERVVNLSYYLSPELLRPGLRDFSWEAGLQREDLGVKSNNYGPWFASTSQRYGFSEWLTLDGRLEVQEDMVAGGAGAVYRIRTLGTVAGGIAASVAGGRRGARGYAQLQRITGAWSLGARIEAATPDFRQLGMIAGEKAPSLGAQVFGSLALTSRQAVTFGYVRLANRAGMPDVDLATVGYNVQFDSGLSASLTAFRSFVDPHAWGAGLNLSYALDARRSLSGAATLRDGHAQAAAQLQQSVPAGTGLGYDLRLGRDQSSRYGGRVLYQNNYGVYTAEAGSAGNGAAFAVGAAGGIVTMGGHTLFSRRVENGFAIVEVPGAPGVDIYSNNQVVATTGAAGVGLIPNLLAYQRNTVRVDERGLPVEMELDLAERIVAPYARSGVLVTIDARRNDGATLRILTADGLPMPLGSQVRLSDGELVHLVARRGEVFLPHITYPATVRVTDAGSHCAFVVEKPASNEPLPRLGPFTCSGNAP